MSGPWCDSDDDDDYGDDHVYKGPEHHIYVGPPGRKRLVLRRDIHGQEYHYKGPKGRERLVMERNGPDGFYSRFFQGCKGQEHLVRTVSDTRDEDSLPREVVHFKGGKGKERKVRVFEGRTGTTKYYEGAKGEECKVRKEWPNGQIDYYKHGSKDRTEYPDGTACTWMHYDGHCVHKSFTHLSGQVDHYDSGRHHDSRYLMRTEWADGTITHYQHRYSDREQYPLVIEHPNGQVCYHGTLLQDKKGHWAGKWGNLSWEMKRAGYRDWQTRIELRDGRVLDNTAFRWVKVRRWVAKRAIALHWQERTQMRLAAPDGAGRRADRTAYEADFGA